MVTVSKSPDLSYDPNEIGPDCVVECWISHGPRADDPTLDPQPGEIVSLIDDDDEPLRGRVFRREGNIVSVQVILPAVVSQTA